MSSHMGRRSVTTYTPNLSSVSVKVCARLELSVHGSGLALGGRAWAVLGQIYMQYGVAESGKNNCELEWMLDLVYSLLYLIYSRFRLKMHALNTHRNDSVNRMYGKVRKACLFFSTFRS